MHQRASEAGGMELLGGITGRGRQYIPETEVGRNIVADGTGKRGLLTGAVAVRAGRTFGS